MMTQAQKSPSPPLAAGEGRGEGAFLQERALRMRKDPTEAEKPIWQKIRNRQINGHKFRRQHPLDGYIPDFVCFEPKAIIEIDGGQHNESVPDAKRDAYFEAQGFKVLRFWNHDVLENIEGVAEAIRSSLPPHPSRAARGPLPSPAASGGEGDDEGVFHA